MPKKGFSIFFEKPFLFKKYVHPLNPNQSFFWPQIKKIHTDFIGVIKGICENPLICG
jgi:hypothetical protein